MKTPLAAVLCFLLGAKSLQAALQCTLSPAVQSGAVGAEVSFTGTLTNTSTTDSLFLNDIQFNLSGAAAASLTPDTNVFFANIPGILLPNETYTGPIFAITINSSANAGDYSGSITIRGGNDIFALTDLASQNFQVSSPLVGISATNVDAKEFGPVPGIFTISRTGEINYDLSVNYTIAGSAINGVRYSLISNSIVVPSGVGNIAIQINPVPNDIAEGTQTVTLTISPSPTYNVGSPLAATIDIHDKPIDEWRLQEFPNQANNSQIAGDLADPEGDGITNLMEYGLLLDPNASSVAELPSVATGGNHLQLSFRRNTSATDISYIIEAASDLAAAPNWAPVMTRASGQNWVASDQGATATETGSGDFVTVTITDSVPIVDPIASQSAGRRFLRLRVQR
jgi:hypothetical protein